MASKTHRVNHGPAKKSTTADPTEGEKSEHEDVEHSEVTAVSSDPTISSIGGPESEVVRESASSASGHWILRPEGDRSEEGEGEITPVGTVGSFSARKKRPAAPKPRLKQRALLREASSAHIVEAEKASTMAGDGEVLRISSVTGNVWQETWSIPPITHHGLGGSAHDFLSSSATMLQIMSGFKTSEEIFADVQKHMLKSTEKSLSESEHPLHRVTAKSAFIKSASSAKPKKKPHTIQSSLSAAKAANELSKGKKGRNAMRKKESERSLDKKEPHYLDQLIPEMTVEDIGTVSVGDSFKKIFESKSAATSGKAVIPLSGIIAPSSSKGFVPSVSSPAVEKRHSGKTSPAAKYCPWTARAILDAWVPQQTKFPTWLTVEEQGTISKNMIKEANISCLPRRKQDYEAPSCCVFKEHERKTKTQLVTSDSNTFRPEVRRWLLGYPQNTRFLRETQDLFRNPPDDVVVHRDDENERHIYIDLRGPQYSLYEDGIFRIEVFFPGEYPKQPPKIRFMTKIYHPNVDKLGRIRLSAIQEKWCASLLMRDVLDALKTTLSLPTVEAPLAIDVARRWFWQESAAKKTAQFWTKKFAHHHSAAAWLDCRCDCCCEHLAAASHFY